MKKTIILFFLLSSLLISDINSNCKIISLNHIKSENSIAMLKALGYSVIDYMQEEDSFIPKLDIFEDIELNNPGITVIKFPFGNSEYLDSVIGEDEEAQSALDGMSAYLGGNSMPDIISGEPPERIMVCYEDGYESDFRMLLEFLKNKIDIAASQVMIEALVIEINSDELDELGINLSGQGENFTAATPNITNVDGAEIITGLSLEYSDIPLLNDDGAPLESVFNANLEAILNSSSGEILSKPSVMVMDGRQARIQIGQHIPITRTTNSSEYTSEDVEYIPTGIILNIRPRISNNSNEILMQVETIITDPEKLSYNSDGILITPIINNRKVETFIRVENNNPFIIGGLISDKKYDTKTGIPLLSKIPLIGKLFSTEGTNNVKKEVIIVLTPHIISTENKSFSRVIPQNSHLFDSFGNELFPNSYRLKDDDIFDLSFIQESPIVSKINTLIKNDNIKDLQDIDPKTYDLLSKSILPGEDILVRRMIYEIIERENYYEYINPDKVIFPKYNGIENLKDEIKLYNIFKSDNPKGLLLNFLTNNEYNKDKPFIRPAFTVEVIDLTPGIKFKSILYDKNQNNKNTILISEPKHLRRLYEVIILKKILSLNPDLNLDIQSFKTGVEIIFPSTESLINNELFIDQDIAQYYYEANLYYEAFENTFNQKIKPILDKIN
tara:strand:- start:5762 stop:7771 length:2010 start_codon:yes stop_codon:yes gene_type:complete